MGWFSVQYHWSPIIANRPSFPAKYNKSFLDELTKSDFLMKIKSRGHREFTSCVVVLRKFTFWPLGFFVALQTRFQLFSVCRVLFCFLDNLLFVSTIYDVSSKEERKQSWNSTICIIVPFRVIKFQDHAWVFFLFRSSGVNQR